MPYFLAIDPGVHHIGIAAIDSNNGSLVRAGWISPKDLDAWIRPFPTIELAIIEKPQIYQTKHQKGDQNDLIDLAIVVGRVARELEWKCKRVQLQTPRQWKGQIPKDVTRARILATLSDSELECVEWPKAKDKRHNVFDAIHLALRSFTNRKV